MKNSILILSLTIFNFQANGMTVDDYLNQYKKKNGLYQAGQLSTEAAAEKINAAELEVAPLLTLDYLKNKDQSLPSQIGPNREIEQYAVGVAKKFTTGTQVKLEAKTLKFENETLIPGFDKYSTGQMGISLKQSLWKDFFGEATRAKMDRTRKVSLLEKKAADLQLNGQLIEAEVLFWDYAFAQEDLKLKNENLKRAKKLYQWTNQRFSNGISDKADMLNAKSLVAVRELQIINAESDLKNYEVKLKQALELDQNDQLPLFSVNTSEARPYLNELRNKKNVIKTELYLSMLEADIKSLVALETEDSLKPDLNIFGNYYYTSSNRDYDKALSDMTRSNYPQSTIGINLTWLLGGSAKSDFMNGLSKDVESSALRSLKLKSDGVLAWNEFLRQYKVISQQSTILDQIVEIQKTRLKAENDRFSKGRSVTANVITAESESAESESNALKAKIGIRKLEASSRLYMAIED